jgi:hypothetical protein
MAATNANAPLVAVGVSTGGQAGGSVVFGAQSYIAEQQSFRRSWTPPS